MTRCLLDVTWSSTLVLDRRPHSIAARVLCAAAERKDLEAIVPAHGVTTLFYLAARGRGAAFARRVVDDLLIVPSIAPADGAILRHGAALGWRDFEDAVWAAAAEAASCDLLVTRDISGFKDSPVLVVDPVTALVRGEGGPGRVSEPRARLRRGRRTARP